MSSTSILKLAVLFVGISPLVDGLGLGEPPDGKACLAAWTDGSAPYNSNQAIQLHERSGGADECNPGGRDGDTGSDLSDGRSAIAGPSEQPRPEAAWPTDHRLPARPKDHQHDSITSSTMRQVTGQSAADRRRPRSPSPPPPCDRSRGSLWPTDLLQTGDGPVAGGSSSSSSHSQPTCSRLTTGSSSSFSHSQPAQQRLHSPRPRPLNGQQVLRLLLRSSVPSLSPRNSTLTDLVSSPHS
ncbi:hypothetical protein PGTUg99_016315 [Puccinia graminis f. sp. tritici]|uniref:Uncharacterized protein n=1 Tax=Puccinia graminis f. sp. tritici TaxID=56615 RepID=A0A5B0PEL9_PUCGR|nr:hypothetical protein PGTUg99_016315 [Puccinia graminis f. sp. tritici]